MGRFDNEQNERGPGARKPAGGKGPLKRFAKPGAKGQENKPGQKRFARPDEIPFAKRFDKVQGKRPGKPGAKGPGLPMPSPAGKPENKPLGLPVKGSLGKLRAKSIGRPIAQPAGKAGGKLGSKPVGLPTPGKPGARPHGKPGERPMGLPTPGKPGARPHGKPGERPGRPARPLRPAGKFVRKPEANAAPPAPVGPLTSARSAWQPAMRWCQKELKEINYMDAQVKVAVTTFNGLVKAVLAASSEEAFRESQRLAVAYVNEHPFLRWAPVPSPLPVI